MAKSNGYDRRDSFEKRSDEQARLSKLSSLLDNKHQKKRRPRFEEDEFDEFYEEKRR